MHELGIAQEMVKIALDHAAKHNARNITQFNIEMSAAADENEDSLRFHIENLIRGTAAAGARVEITRVSVEARCLDCGNEFAIQSTEDGCPRCSGQRVRSVVCDEFRLASIEVE
jgi:hydrogenase nickel incorporation protein HypA/HybF